jgi:hypothetical protein
MSSEAVHVQAGQAKHRVHVLPQVWGRPIQLGLYRGWPWYVTAGVAAFGAWVAAGWR